MLLTYPTNADRGVPRGATVAWLRAALLALGAVMLFGCASSNRRAPVEDRSPRPAAPVASAPVAVAPAPAAPATAEVKLPPGAENAGRPGYYTVKPGDTLIRIGLDSGQNWRDIQRWNKLENPNLIEVGQVLRVLPPSVDAAAVATRPVNTARVDAKPLDTRPGGGAAGAAASGTAAAGSAAAPPTAAVPPPAPSAPSAVALTPAAASAAGAAATRDEDELQWAWPAGGSVLAGFEEARNKGIAIGGKSGDAVVAAADGRVVYAGSGLRGYGNLVIVKHNATYLSAYAHNQALLVKEDQAVKRGQKIAEMGSTDAERVQLHFEIRRQGKPVDPVKLLPAR